MQHVTGDPERLHFEVRIEGLRHELLDVLLRLGAAEGEAAETSRLAEVEGIIPSHLRIVNKTVKGGTFEDCLTVCSNIIVRFR